MIFPAPDGMQCGPERGRRFLGIDPGLQITGYAVIEAGTQGPIICEAGIIRGAEGRAHAELAPRLLNLYNGIVEVIEHPRTAILMAHARGVMFLAAGQRGLDVVSYNATQIKKAITGSGRASKDQMQRTMQRELRLPRLPEPPDVADALAAALCHYYSRKLPVPEKS
jgi:crossover junction endodeoxyribonuclease RuvC